MEILSNYDYNKKFISPDEFLTILTDIKNISNYKIIQVSFKYIINNKYVEDCYTSTIIYQYILSNKKNRSNIYNDLFYLDTINDHVYINYITNIFNTSNNNNEKIIYSFPISIENINYLY